MTRVSDDGSNSWSWSTCNVKSLKNKVPHFKKVFEDTEVAALQETHSEKWQEDSIRLRLGFDEGVLSSYGPAARGAALVWRRPWILVAKNKDTEGRIAGAVLRRKTTRVAFLCAYAPNLNRSAQSRQEYVTWLIGLRALIEELCTKGQTRGRHFHAT